MEDYFDFELDRVIKTIKDDNCKVVCIQLPDGLKPKAAIIQEEIEKKTSAKVIIYGGSCWGGCDVPVGLDRMGVDLLVQFGHAIFRKPW